MATSKTFQVALVTMGTLKQGTVPVNTCHLQDGVWIRGLFLEGAGWDKKSSSLVEANPMQLVCPMPTIHFKPVEGKRRSAKGESILTKGLAFVLSNGYGYITSINDLFGLIRFGECGRVGLIPPIAVGVLNFDSEPNVNI